MRQNEAGIFGATVTILIERRRPDHTWQTARTLEVTEKQTALFEIQVLIPLEPVTSGEATPEVRVTRQTPRSTETALRNDVDLVAVTWLRWEKLNYPGVSTLGLRFDADSFSGRLPRVSVDLKGRLIRVPVNYDPLTRRSAGIWNGAFRSAWSNNPAWVLLDLLTDRDWGLGLDDQLIEVFDLHAIAAYCDAAVTDGRGSTEPRFQFDGVITRRLPAVEVIGQVCAAMRVHYFWSGGRLRFIQDKPGDAVMVLTNALVEDGSFVYSGPGLSAGFSHALVSYTDSESDSGISVEAEINPRWLARHGYKSREVAVLGCRRRSQARRHARWLIETAAADLHGVSWHASLDHFAENPIRPGDIVRICDSNRLDAGAVPGRIDSIDNGVIQAEMQIDPWPDASFDALLDYETTTSGWQEDVAVSITPGTVGQVRMMPVAPRHRQCRLAGATAPGWCFLMRRKSTVGKGEDYRILQLREVDRHRLEVSAVRYDAKLYDRVDNGLILMPPRVMTGRVLLIRCRWHRG